MLEMVTLKAVMGHTDDLCSNCTAPQGSVVRRDPGRASAPSPAPACVRNPRPGWLCGRVLCARHTNTGLGTDTTKWQASCQSEVLHYPGKSLKPRFSMT